MKTNRTWIAAMVAGGLLAFGQLLMAQNTNTSPDGAPPARKHAGPNIDHLAKTLNLTDDQKAKVQTIIENQGQQMKDLRQDTSLSREDKRAKMKAIHEDTQAKMKEVLTPDQFTQFQQMMPGHRPHRPQPPAANSDATNNPPQQ